MTQRAMPQLSFLELIVFTMGNSAIGDYWQRISGGDIQVASARHGAPNRRTSQPVSGKFTYGALTLERDYIPNDANINILAAILAHLGDPGNDQNDISIIRVLNNSPKPNKNRTVVTYNRCVPTSIPMLSDGDTTADANIMPTRLSFEYSSVTIEINGRIFDIDQLVGGGWAGASGALIAGGTGGGAQSLSA